MAISHLFTPRFSYFPSLPSFSKLFSHVFLYIHYILQALSAVLCHPLSLLSNYFSAFYSCTHVLEPFSILVVHLKSFNHISLLILSIMQASSTLP